MVHTIKMNLLEDVGCGDRRGRGNMDDGIGGLAAKAGIGSAVAETATDGTLHVLDIRHIQAITRELCGYGRDMIEADRTTNQMGAIVAGTLDVGTSGLSQFA
jgi:hypothetical protein